MPAASFDSNYHVKTPLQQQTSPENHTDDGGSGSSKEASTNFVSHNHRLGDSGGSSTNNERKRRLSFSSTTSTEPEKVSIVRAAGTFFPQNCNDNESDTSTSPAQASSSSLPSPSTAQNLKPKETMDCLRKCCVTGCNESTDSAHMHCDDCSEVCTMSCYVLFIANTGADSQIKLIPHFRCSMMKQS